MVKTTFSTSWKSSTQPRKQRKYRHNAPMHLQQRVLHVHLSSELRGKHKVRNVRVRKGDTVRVMRGTFAKKDGKVDRVVIKRSKIYITGLEADRRDGSKKLVGFEPSNLLITSLDMSDPKRKQKLSSTTETSTTATKEKTSK